MGAGFGFRSLLGLGGGTLCEAHKRTVERNNCVRFEGLALKLPPDCYRCHYAKTKVKVRRQADGSLSV